MIRTREAVKRWMVFPVFVAVVCATSVLANATVRQLGWADEAEHLFRSVADRGADERPINGTVTRTASQARTAGRAVDVTTSVPNVLRGSSGSATETASERQMQGPEVRAGREVGSVVDLSASSVLLPSVSDSAGRRGSEIRELRELRQLREENRTLKGLVTDLWGRTGPTGSRHRATRGRPSRARSSAVVPFRQ